MTGRSRHRGTPSYPFGRVGRWFDGLGVVSSCETIELFGELRGQRVDRPVACKDFSREALLLSCHSIHNIDASSCIEIKAASSSFSLEHHETIVERQEQEKLRVRIYLS
jgi:hypothetical protein